MKNFKKTLQAINYIQKKIQFINFFILSKHTKILQKDKKINTDILMRKLETINFMKIGKYNNLIRIFLSDPLFLMLIYLSLSKTINKQLFSTKKNMYYFIFQFLALKIKRNQFQFTKNQKIKNKKLIALFEGVLQRSFFLILYHIFILKEKRFQLNEHGSILNRNLHTCIKKIKRSWNSLFWYIKIEFDTLSQDTAKQYILRILKKKIKDSHFLFLINNYIVAKKKILLTSKRKTKMNLEITQKQTLWSLLMNLYLYEIDMYLNTFLVPKYNRFVAWTASSFYQKEKKSVTIKYLRFGYTLLIGFRAINCVVNLFKENLFFFLKSHIQNLEAVKKFNIINLFVKPLSIWNFYLFFDLKVQKKLNKLHWSRQKRQLGLQKKNVLKRKKEKQYRFYLLKRFQDLKFKEKHKVYAKGIQMLLELTFSDEKYNFLSKNLTKKVFQSMLARITGKSLAFIVELNSFVRAQNYVKKKSKDIKDMRCKSQVFFLKRILNKKKVLYSDSIWDVYIHLWRNGKVLYSQYTQNHFLFQKMINHLQIKMKSQKKGKTLITQSSKINEIQKIEYNQFFTKEVKIKANKEHIVGLLKAEKFLTVKGKPKACKHFFFYSDVDIFRIYNKFFFNFLFYYKYIENFIEIKNFFLFFLKFSFLKTLATKHRLCSIRKTYLKYRYLMKKLKKFISL